MLHKRIDKKFKQVKQKQKVTNEIYWAKFEQYRFQKTERKKLLTKLAL